MSWYKLNKLHVYSIYQLFLGATCQPVVIFTEQIKIRPKFYIIPSVFVGFSWSTTAFNPAVDTRAHSRAHLQYSATRPPVARSTPPNYILIVDS